MGIGRRKFLKLFGAVIASAASNPLQAVIVQGDLYINRALGLAYKKPNGWYFVSMEALCRHRSIVVLREKQLYTVNMFDYPTLCRTVDQEYVVFKDEFKLV